MKGTLSKRRMANFTCIFIVLVLTACAYGDSSEESIEAHEQKFEKCRKEVWKNEGGPHGPPNPDGPKEKCFHACLARESGEMENGKLVIEKVLESHKKHGHDFNDDVEDKITYCVETANEKPDECDVVGTMMKCIFEKMGPPPPPPHRRSQQ